MSSNIHPVARLAPIIVNFRINDSVESNSVGMCWDEDMMGKPTK
jgi:hypothetical protein